MTEDARFDEHALPRLERMVGHSVLSEVLDLYAKSVPERLEVVRSGLESGDLDAAARALHDLKSSAGMVGAAGVQILAGEMEELAREGDTDGLRRRLGRLVTALETTGQTLDEARRRRE